MTAADPLRDPRAEEILALFADEARIERSRLEALELRADELGIGSLDLSLALFEIEERYGIDLPDWPPTGPLPTVGELLQQVLAALDAQAAADAGRAVGAAGAAAPPAARVAGAH